MEVAAISGACTLISREVLDNIGFLDESLPMGGEDIDWYFRMRKRGYKIYYLAQPRVIHIGGASRVLDISRSDTEEFKSYYYYFLKHLGLSAAHQYRTILGVSMLLRGLFLIGKMIAYSPQNQLVRKKIEVTKSMLRWAIGLEVR
jgi:GT2 family glycosyltransferase